MVHSGLAYVAGDEISVVSRELIIPENDSPLPNSHSWREYNVSIVLVYPVKKWVCVSCYSTVAQLNQTQKFNGHITL